MFRLLASILTTVTATVLLVGVSSASTVPYRERSSGTLTDVVPGHLSFNGQGRATILGNYTSVGDNSFDDQGHVLDGHITVTTQDNATATGVYSGTYAPLSSGQIQFTVTVTWQSGTGRLTGVTGQADVVALIEAVAPGGAFRAEGLGRLVLP